MIGRAEPMVSEFDELLPRELEKLGLQPEMFEGIASNYEARCRLKGLRDRAGLTDEDINRWCFYRYLFNHLRNRVMPTEREKERRAEHRWITIKERPYNEKEKA